MQNFTELFNISRAAQTASSIKDFSHQVYITGDNAPRTIYLADLPKSITYLELSEFFEKNIGPCVISIKRPMFKDFYYAFVQFQKLDDAKKAYEEHKYPTLCGVKCRILPFNKQHIPGAMPQSFPHKPTKPQKNTQLFVKGLPKQWTHEDLFHQFEKFGRILSCKVSVDGEFNSRQYGFVQLETEKATNEAIAKMDKLDIPATDDHDEAKLQVCEFVPRLDRIGTTKPRCSTNLYVKNFPQDDFTEESLRQMFEPFGKLQSYCIMRDENQKSKQFGFVCFQQSEHAQEAMDHFNQLRQLGSQEDKENTKQERSGKRVFVCEAKTKQQRRHEIEKSTYQFKRSMHLLNLIVKNVDPDCTKEEFEAFFGNFGEVKSVKLIPDASIGFVCFNERESARMAKENAELVLRGRKMHADFCEPKESRQKRQEEQWDRQQYNKQKASQMSTNNHDVISLITSLSLLMSQLQNNKGGKTMGPGGNQGGQFNGHHGGARMANRQGGGGPYQNKQPHQQQYYNQNPMTPQQQVPMGQPHHYGGGQRMMHQQQNQGGQQPMMNMPMPMPHPNQQRHNQQPPQQDQNQQQVTESSKYRHEIMQIFMSEKFMSSSDPNKKQMLGTHIFRYVTNLVTSEFSPKITGMIIDLPMADLNYSVSTLETLQLKVRSAVQLLVDTSNMPEQQASQLPVWHIMSSSSNGSGAAVQPGHPQSAQPPAQQQKQVY